MVYKWYEMSVVQKIVSVVGWVCFAFSLLAVFLGIVNLLEYSKVIFLSHGLLGLYSLSRAFLIKKRKAAILSFIVTAVLISLCILFIFI